MIQVWETWCSNPNWVLQVTKETGILEAVLQDAYRIAIGAVQGLAWLVSLGCDHVRQQLLSATSVSVELCESVWKDLPQRFTFFADTWNKWVISV